MLHMLLSAYCHLFQGWVSRFFSIVVMRIPPSDQSSYFNPTKRGGNLLTISNSPECSHVERQDRPPALLPRGLRSQGLRGHPQRQTCRLHARWRYSPPSPTRQERFPRRRRRLSAVAKHLYDLWTDKALYKRMCEYAKHSVSDEVGTWGNAAAWMYLATKFATGDWLKPNGRWINDMMREDAGEVYAEASLDSPDKPSLSRSRV
jgi:hypothetical protein